MMSITTETIAKRLSQAMEFRGMSAAELSRRTGINESAISHYRKGEYAPKQDRIYLISNALNVRPSWLLGYDTDPAPVDAAITDLFEQLPTRQQEQVLDYVRFLLNNQK